jgi:curved DNA-binding protein CbpA
VQGQLGEKLIPDIIRELVQKNASGLLRLTRGKTIKAIFFDNGSPVFAISNLAPDQLENKLVKEGIATPDQINQAKAMAGKANKLGTMLVQMGVLPEGEMKKRVRAQVMDIILSLFEWNEGEYVFDERIRASHEVTLDISAADVILEGARHAASLQQISEAIAPSESVIVRPRINGARLDTGRLMPIESYILSRIDNATAVSEVGAISGLPDEDAQRAVCALVAAGFLKLLDDKKEEAEEEADEDLNRLREDIARKFHFFASADYYEILGVTRQSNTSEIKAAYYQMAKKYHPDRYRQPEYADIRAKLETLFARISQAYDTLREAGPRAAYDDQMRRPAKAAAKTEPLAPPAAPVVSTPLSSKREEPYGHRPEPEKPHTPTAGHEPASEPAATVVAAQPASETRQSGSGQTAEHYFQQGRARYERKEYHAAIHLLREAVKLDPSKPQYHFHLGVALMRNPRTRREAEQHLAKAAELDPINAQIRVRLGMLYKEAGLTKKAEQFFRQALQLDPGNRVARNELGGAASQKKDKKEESIWKSDLSTIAKKLFKK